MKRSKHGLSHYNLTTCDMGFLVPVGCYEVLPGDTVQQRTSALIRALPLNLPVMHPVQVRMHSFFVPNRLLWDGWEDFITGADYAAPGTYPSITSTATAKNLEDYLGVPRVTGLDIGALPFRAYNMIYNEFYRDQDLIPEVAEDSVALQKISWGKDYFAGARPWTQKGTPVTVPLGGTAPITGIGLTQAAELADGITVNETDAAGGAFAQSQQTSNAAIRILTSGSQTGGIDEPKIYADLANATGTDINEFRRAFALQRYQEARARYGSRYTEYLRYLGVKPSDARLQRPEYLGGGKQTIAFSEILQTGPDSTQGGQPTDGAVGMFRGHGIAALRTRRFRRFFEEHGHVLTLMSVRPKTVYNEALHRLWSRRTKEDYYQKELESIGQQEVYSREVYAEADPAGATVFGYADRYREYREHPSYTTGEMRVGDVLDPFHLARSFSSAPTLNQSFVECDPSKRIFRVETNDTLWCMLQHSVQARRMVNRSAHARII